MKKNILCLLIINLAFLASAYDIWDYYDGLKLNDPKTVQFCLKNLSSWDLFERNDEGKSAAIKAIDQNDLNVLKVLAQISAESAFVTSDENENDCLMYAVIHDKLSAFKTMLENADSVDELSYGRENDDGKTLLDLVMLPGKEEFARFTFKFLFMQPKGVANLAYLFNEKNPYVFTAVKKGYIDVNYRFEEGVTLVQKLCDIYYDEDEAAEAIDFLCEHGANVNTFDDKDESPFTVAMWNDYPKRAAVILANGYDVDMEDKFHCSAMTSTITSVNKHPEVLEELCKAGVDVNKRLTGEKSRYTPLTYALNTWDNWACIEILLRYGADIQLKDGWGSVPLDILKTKSKKDYYKLAKKAGYIK
ncbi:MAG: hypothetical protein IJ530_05575 [Treponema sp.]|uniref:ankyrin repeat domain-containing protein n=1 Tax=Treponema sp. TaxID=166 RepID=UPI0025E281B7|nr:ankyrin repeat domain-containing protein [Treponema sp.]MBQ8679218.1 hypothetical protein [Treponema sp.]